ncbi:proline-rich domain-containing protein [Streptomyces sp. NPDC001492]
MGICDTAADPILWVACKGKGAVGDAASGAVDSVAGSAWSQIVHSFTSAAASLIKTVATGWLGMDSPQLSTSGGPVAFMFAHTQWLTIWASVLALLLAAGHMAWTQRTEPAREAAIALLKVVASGSAYVTGANLLLAGGDAFAVWIVNESTHCGGGDTPTKACTQAFTEKLVNYSLLTTSTKPELLGLAFVFALLLIVGSIAQIGFMLARNAMLIVLVSTLPLSAAASGTVTGKTWWKKTSSWLIAFILYKPVAAIVYAAAFSSITQGNDKADGENLTVQLAGVVLLLLAALTLPALMRIASPLVDQVAQGRQGSGGSVIGGAAAVATGAVALKTGGASTAASTVTSAAGKGAVGASGSRNPGGGPPPGGGSQPPPASPSGGSSPGGSPPAGSPPADAPSHNGTPQPGGPQGGSARPHGGTQVIPQRPATDSTEGGPRGSNR